MQGFTHTFTLTGGLERRRHPGSGTRRNEVAAVVHVAEPLEENELGQPGEANPLREDLADSGADVDHGALLPPV